MKRIAQHKYRIISGIFLSALIVSISILPVQAYGGQYPAFNDQFGIRSSINVGFRLSIPLGPTSRTEDNVKYGFQMSLRREFSNDSGWNNVGHISAPQVFNADLMSFNFSENGFKNMSLAGQETLIYQNGVLKAADGKSSGKYYTGMALGIVGGMVIAAGVVALVVLADK